MITIYICNFIEDVAAFIKMFPEACWSNDSLLNVDNDFNLHRSPPTALYKVPNVNAVTWSAVSDDEHHLQFNYSNYTLGTLKPLLDLATVFTTFLKHHNAYNKFITQDFFCTNDILFMRLLLGTFDWEESPEGYEYWDDIDDKWRDLVNTLKLNRNEVISNLLDILH